ncbi:MAG: V4R domain-containing protein [Euryarchaeota archaeon]
MRLVRERIFRKVEESLEGIEEARPTLGDEVKLSAVRHMLASMVVTLGRGAGSTFYRAGFDIGVYKAERHEVRGLEEALRYIHDSLKRTRLGLVEEAEVKDDGSIEIVMTESATAAGYSVNEKLCYFQAGYMAGVLRAATGDRWQVRELECVAEGHDACRFIAQRRG